MTVSTEDVFTRLARERGRHLEELEEYLRIPSISTDPAHQADVERCADWLLARMKEAGLSTRKIATAGNPLVYAEWMGAGAAKPTVLFYGHYDVQPPDPLEEWRHPPFEPTIEGEQLVARGSTDDKGQSYCHLKGVERCSGARRRRSISSSSGRGVGRRSDREVRP
jgi:acetylornithine deacetylase/succinyl-diaminopimelate desuccinylase-like protein